MWGSERDRFFPIVLATRVFGDVRGQVHVSRRIRSNTVFSALSLEACKWCFGVKYALSRPAPTTTPKSASQTLESWKYSILWPRVKQRAISPPAHSSTESASYHCHRKRTTAVFRAKQRALSPHSLTAAADRPLRLPDSPPPPQAFPRWQGRRGRATP